MPRLKTGLQVHGAKAQHRTLTKAVQHFECGQLALLKTKQNRLQLPVFAFRQSLHPLLTVGIGGIAQGEHAVQAAQIGGCRNQCCGRIAQHLLLATGGGLVQVGIEQPQRLAVGHNGLGERLGVLEAEAAGALEFKRAAAGLAAWGGFAVFFGRGHNLGESGLTLLRGAQEGGQIGQAVGQGDTRQHQRPQPTQRAAHEA